MQKITTFLWFDNQAVEAARFYTGIFKNSRLHNVDTFDNEEHGVDGKTILVKFELEGQEFMALNGGPMFKFNPAISLFVDCVDQAEVDELWEKLLEGGQTSACGWLTDKYGLSWQIIPRRLGELLGDPDRDRAQRALEAMMQMIKIDVATLERAADGG